MSDNKASVSSTEPLRPVPPPLPPRGRSTTEVPTEPPPPYSEWSEDKRQSVLSQQWRSRDPRSSSMHSLVPSESARDGRRTLLLVYIHGFMGNETSFQSFPAHVHNLLTISMSETHVVHTKIYPRYKSRRAIEYAVEDFSTWLEPHEDDNTDVVLLGHSMGGILDVDVALLQPKSPATGRPFRHRILGTINFDTPFLGMHPGLVISGISSLFRPAPEMPGVPKEPREGTLSPSTTTTSASQSTTSFFTQAESMTSGTSASLSPTQSAILSPPSDPNYNRPFPNDVRIQERSGWSSVLHFINKHSDGLTSATKQYFMSHIEFGGCLADWQGLKNRYSKIRALEDVDETLRPVGPGYHKPIKRIRFINYYTASTGIPKKPKVKKEDTEDHLKPTEVEMQDMSIRSSRSRSVTPTPSVSVDEYSEGRVTPQPVNEGPDASAIEAQMQNLGDASGVHDPHSDGEGSIPPMQHIDSMPIPDSDDEDTPAVVAHPIIPSTERLSESSEASESTPSLTKTTTTSSTLNSALPPIPPAPTEPSPLDLTPYTSKDSRKLAEKEHKHVIKAYQKAVKDRDNAIKDRKKLVEKREKKARQELEKEAKAEEKKHRQDTEKLRKEAEKLRMKEAKEEQKRLEEERKEAEIRALTINPEPLSPSPSPSASATTSTTGEATATTAEKKTKKKKKDGKFCLLPSDINGKRDTCWVRVYMEGVDEVGAHCGLFFQGPQYESLVGDVGRRIEGWVREDRAARESAGGGEMGVALD